MNFHLHQPSGFLAQFIESIVYFDKYSPTHDVEQMLPDGYQDLVIDLTDQPKYIFDNHSLLVKQKCSEAWLSGTRTSLITIDAGGTDSSMMVVRFKHGAAFHFTQFPITEVKDQVLDSDLIFGDKIKILRSDIKTASLVSDKIDTVERFLEQQLLPEEIPSAVTFAVEAIKSNPSTQTIEWVASKTGYSQKHFINLFKKHLGITPKGFQKIQRFQKVVLEIDSTCQINWTQLSLDCGYYDQAHFINEFKAFSGYSPKQYLTVKGPLINYIPVR
ncbi:AraC family transcriptional regulator [Ekhidna sp.]|uniref:AraC family transcriptional regulator n=1 Tax=Ekhidna sp. TaxID=2608089 RepID=UPI0032968DAA